MRVWGRKIADLWQRVAFVQAAMEKPLQEVKVCNLGLPPCPCKCPIQNYFWHKCFICQPIFKHFLAHFTTNVGLNILAGKYAEQKRHRNSNI